MTLRGQSLAIPYPSLYFSLFPFSSPLHVEYLCRIILSLHMDIPHLALSKARQPWPVYPFVIFVCFCSPLTVRRQTEPTVLSIVLQLRGLFALLIPSADRFTIHQHRLLAIAIATPPPFQLPSPSSRLHLARSAHRTFSLIKERGLSSFSPFTLLRSNPHIR